jgi:hypothetical protein
MSIHDLDLFYELALYIFTIALPRARNERSPVITSNTIDAKFQYYRMRKRRSNTDALHADHTSTGDSHIAEYAQNTLVISKTVYTFS